MEVLLMCQPPCFAGLDRDAIKILNAALAVIGTWNPAVVSGLTVVAIGSVKPELLVCDIDRSESDPLELLRQVHFVLSASIILVYTDRANGLWNVGCRTAGANGLLSKQSNITELAAGVRSAMRVGCFTDPRCAA